MKKFILLISLFSSIAMAVITPERYMSGNCLTGYQNQYKIQKNHKAFAYASEENTGKSSCGWGYGYKTIQEARDSAFSYCRKRSINAECKIFDEDGKIVASDGDFSEIIPKSDRYLSGEEYDKYISESKEIIEVKNCLTLFKYYLREKEHKAFYLARDSEGKEVCGKSKNWFSPAKANEVALAECNKALKKKNLNATCKPYAQNFLIVGKAEDFGYVKNQDDYTNSIYRGKLSKIKRYIAEGYDINATSKDGLSPIFVAAALNDEDFFFFLIEKGANIKQIANDNSTLLMAAIMGENPNIIRYLLKNGLDINTQARQKNTPLHLAFMKFNTYLIELLMQEGADASIKNEKGVSGYDLAKKWKIDLDSLKKLDINKKKNGCNQVFYAAQKGDIGALEKLASLKADFKNSCDEGLPLLSYSSDDKKIIKLLLANGVDINAKNSSGETALMHSTISTKKVKILLELGADKKIKDSNGQTAYERVKNKKDVTQELKDLLQY